MKRALSSILVALIALSATACGSAQTSTDKTSTSSANQSASASSDSVSSETSDMPERLAKYGFTGTAWLEDSSTPIVEEPITYTVMSLSHATLGGTAEDYAVNTFFTDLTESTNIHFDFQYVAGSGTEFTEKANLLLSSGDYPEVFFKANFNKSTLLKNGSDGIFVDLAPYIPEYMPNLSGLLEEYPEYKLGWTTQEGNIYAFGAIKPPTAVEKFSFWINTTWLEELGLDMPENTDELYNVLKAFKEQDPNGNGMADEIPMALHGTGILTEMYNFWGLPSRTYNASETHIFQDDDGSFKFIPEMEEFKEFLTFAQKLYSEGLLNKDCFTTTQDDIKAQNSQEDEVVGMFVNNHMMGTGLSQKYPNGDLNDPDQIRDADYGYLKPLTPDNGRAPISNGGNSISAGAFAITDICENPEPMIVLVDWLYTEAGGSAVWGGREGIDYAVSDEYGMYWLNENGERAVGQAESDVRKMHTIQPGGSYFCLNPSTLAENGYGTEAQEIYKYIKDTGRKAVPGMYFTESQTKEMATIVADVEPAINTYIADVVTGKKNLDSDYDAFIDSVKKMGIDRIVEFYTETYEKMSAE